MGHFETLHEKIGESIAVAASYVRSFPITTDRSCYDRGMENPPVFPIDFAKPQAPVHLFCATRPLRMAPGGFGCLFGERIIPAW